MIMMMTTTPPRLRHTHTHRPTPTRWLPFWPLLQNQISLVIAFYWRVKWLQLAAQSCLSIVCLARSRISLRRIARKTQVLALARLLLHSHRCGGIRHNTLPFVIQLIMRLLTCVRLRFLCVRGESVGACAIYTLSKHTVSAIIIIALAIKMMFF